MATENAEQQMNPEQKRAGKAALELMRPLLFALDPARLIYPRIDVWRAAPFALVVAQRVNEPQRRELFAKLPPEKFNLSWLGQLEPAALATMYVRSEIATAQALSTDAKLPVPLAQEALVVRERMLKLASFHLGEHPVHGPDLADIRLGTGYADMAQDLLRLSPIYRKNLELLSRDPSFYVAEDPDDAERLAKQIQLELGLSGAPRDNPKELLARAWTFLYTTYEQIAVPGRWLFADSGGAELFPSLNTIGRKPPRGRKAAKDNTEA